MRLWLSFILAIPALAQIAVPAGNRLVLTAHAVGTQNYYCGAAGTWVFFSPQATLFSRTGKQIATHFLSLLPGKDTPAPTWQSSVDSSAVWGSKIGSIAAGTSPSCPTDSAIPCLLLKAAGNKPPGRGLLAQVNYIQRLSTVGGMAPAGSCKAGEQALVPYQAEYLFYTDAAKRK